MNAPVFTCFSRSASTAGSSRSRLEVLTSFTSRTFSFTGAVIEKSCISSDSLIYDPFMISSSKLKTRSRPGKVTRLALDLGPSGFFWFVFNSMKVLKVTSVTSKSCFSFMERRNETLRFKKWLLSADVSPVGFLKRPLTPAGCWSETLRPVFYIQWLHYPFYFCLAWLEISLSESVKDSKLSRWGCSGFVIGSLTFKPFLSFCICFYLNIEIISTKVKLNPAGGLPS